MMLLLKSPLRSLLILLLCLFSLGLASGAAETALDSNAPKTPSNISDEPGVLTLNLMALDKDGRAVTDLKTGELHLFVDKVEQKIQSLSPSANDGLTLGFFFDVSGSRRADSHVVEETHLASQLLRTVWHEGDTAFLVAFNDRAYLDVPPTRKLEEMDEGLKRIPSENRSSTSLYDALSYIEPYRLAGISGHKIFVIFSDFGDNSSRNRADRALEVARQNEISLFPVILGEGFGGSDKRMDKRARVVAREFAEETGGEVLMPESPKQLAATFDRLANDLKAGYRITYTSSSTSPENKKKKKIQLETTRPHVKLIYPSS